MNTDFAKKHTRKDIILRGFIVILVLLSIIALIQPVYFFGSNFIHLSKTYSYTRTDKQFLKYENNTVYTTDGCEYEDKDNSFKKLVINEPGNSVMEGARVEVYTSDLTGEVFCVKIHSSDYIFSLDNTQYKSYINKENETENFLTFSALVVALIFFIATALCVFFTKNSRKRNLYALFYAIALSIGIISRVLSLVTSEDINEFPLCAVFLIISLLYGATTFYLSHRIIMPNLILASTLTVIASIGTSKCIDMPLDFILQSSDLVIFSLLGTLTIHLIRKASVGKNGQLAHFFLRSEDLNADKSKFPSSYIPALLLLFAELFLQHQTSLLSNGDYAALLYLFPAMFIIPPLYGFVSNLFTSRIIIPHVIFVTACFPIILLASLPSFNVSSNDLIVRCFGTSCLLTVFSLIPALLLHMIRVIIRLSKRKDQTKEHDGNVSLS